LGEKKKKVGWWRRVGVRHVGRQTKQGPRVLELWHHIRSDKGVVVVVIEPPKV